MQREVLKRVEVEYLDWIAILILPLKVLTNTGSDIARDFSLQQETIDFCSNFRVRAMQDEALSSTVPRVPTRSAAQATSMRSLQLGSWKG